MGMSNVDGIWWWGMWKVIRFWWGQENRTHIIDIYFVGERETQDYKLGVIIFNTLSQHTESQIILQ